MIKPHRANFLINNSGVYIFLVILFSFIFSGCSSTLPTSKNQTPLIKSTSMTADRATQLLAMQHWKIEGKIAFITPQEKESAGISWRINEQIGTQQLNLNSYLGINVLDLTSEQSQHTIKFDGKTYTGSNLPELIQSLTGLHLPVEALKFWLKSIPYNTADQILFDSTSHLPTKLTSLYQGELWQINYQQYKTIGAYPLATKMMITKDDLLIKIAINKWQVLP
jgi:outer membrane lipoprotein LolB